MTFPSRHDPLTAQRCKIFTARVEYLCAALVAGQTAILVVAAGGYLSGTELALVSGLTFFGLWPVWVATLIQNFRLVRCGPRKLRFEYSKRLINRPELPVRAAFHVIINWSVIGSTLVTIALGQSGRFSAMVTYICMIATVLVWTHFNLLHRRMNRKSNLALSSAIGITLLVTAGSMVSRAG